MPTGVVADLYSRRRSVLIGMFLYGLGFLMEGALPWFAPVLLAQVVWGCGDTFITGALEAWIASEEEDKPIDKVFLRGSQMGQIGGVLGVVLGTLLGNINLQMPIILGGSLCLLLGLVASCQKPTSPLLLRNGRACLKTLSACSSSTWAL